MRFISNAFIISTVALLSLITPVVNANVAVITTPTAGQQINAFAGVNVTWIITDSQGLNGVNCDIALLQAQPNTDIPPSPGILQSDVSILSGESNGPVDIPDVPSGDNYFMQLLSEDQNTVFAQSGIFSIL